MATAHVRAYDRPLEEVGLHPEVSTSQAMRGLRQARAILRFGFTVAPILFGLDKFFNLMVDWTKYLAPRITGLLPMSASTFMRGVGVVEIVAGLIVATRPYFGGYLVAVWLWAIIANLLMVPGYYDIALRDFGLSLAAIALARMSRGLDRRRA